MDFRGYKKSYDNVTSVSLSAAFCLVISYCIVLNLAVDYKKLSGRPKFRSVFSQVPVVVCGPFAIYLLLKKVFQNFKK
jgi:hypothetical protein